MWTKCWFYVDNQRSISDQFDIVDNTPVIQNNSEAYPHAFVQAFHVAGSGFSGLLHKLTAPTTNATEFTYIFI